MVRAVTAVTAILVVATTVVAIPEHAYGSHSA
jgi:hypothetical protein